MDNLTKVAYFSTKNYFDYLSQFGYRSDKDISKLLVMQFIEELLYGKLSLYVDENDYKIIENALYCIYGDNCLIPFPQYNINKNILDFTIMDYRARITEDENIRVTEDGDVRIGK